MDSEVHDVHRLVYNNVLHHLMGFDEDDDKLFTCEEWHVELGEVTGRVTLDENHTEIVPEEPITVTVNQENYELIDIE